MDKSLKDAYHSSGRQSNRYFATSAFGDDDNNSNDGNTRNNSIMTIIVLRTYKFCRVYQLCNYNNVTRFIHIRLFGNRPKFVVNVSNTLC